MLTILSHMLGNDHYVRIHYVPLHHKESIKFGFDQDLIYPRKYENTNIIIVFETYYV